MPLDWPIRPGDLDQYPDTQSSLNSLGILRKNISNSKDSDQTARMRRLVRIFTVYNVKRLVYTLDALAV